tara:strand:+ start:255 stop:665 length:411 start_codon:yes stop_codon:yes gene_type:complete
MLYGNPSQTVSMGAVYNANTLPVYDGKTHTFYNSIRSKTLGETTNDNFNEVSFIDTKFQEKLLQHAAKSYLLSVTGDARITTGNNFNNHIVGYQTITINKAYKHAAKTDISLQAGASKISMTPDQITLIAAKINVT